MKKTFVIDTNVLLQDPNALFAFDDNEVVLTEAVLEELDNFKKGHNELNVNARIVARSIKELKEKARLNGSKLTDGVDLDNGGRLIIETNHKDVELPSNWETSKADNRILQVCKALLDENKDVHLITKDIMMAIKSDIINVISEDFENEKMPKIDDQYKGKRVVYTSQENLSKFFSNGSILLDSVFDYDINSNKIEINNLFENEFLIIKSNETSSTALGKVHNNEISKLYYDNKHPYGVTPKNVTQKFMQEALLDDVENIPLVILKGPAGTAKTFYSLAAGLENVTNNNDKKFRRILVCRPNQTLDEDLGFLPGDEKEKIAPLMRPIMDNLEILVDSDKKERYADEEELSDKIQELFERKLIDMQAVGFLRGRSIVKHWMIIDEAQNLTPKAAKAIVTRAGEGTKLILCGDPDQVDNPFMDSRTNGLSYIAEHMKGSKLCCVITADESECVRSPLAKEAIKLLKG